MEVPLHGGSEVGGRTAKQIHRPILTSFRLSSNTYRLNQLRYDLRNLKGHALLQRDGSRYSYYLTTKGIQVALLFFFFHKRLCGPLANSRLSSQTQRCPPATLQTRGRYYKADQAIEQIVDLLKAA